jgi:hypothetical protein
MHGKSDSACIPSVSGPDNPAPFCHLYYYSQVPSVLLPNSAYGHRRAAYHAPMNSTTDSSPAPCPSLACAIRAHHSLCTLVHPGAFAQRKAVMHQWCEAPEAGGMTEREKQK